MYSCLASPPFEVIGLWIFVAGLVGYAAMAQDKEKALDREYRMSEKNLIYIAFFGGFLGILIAMERLHHKYEKLRFSLLAYTATAVWLLGLLSLTKLLCH